MSPRESTTEPRHSSPHPSTSIVAVLPVGGDARIRAKAEHIARELALPLIREADAGYDLHLVVNADRLELRDTRPPAPGPIHVDFIKGAVGYSRRVNRFGLLFQAAGLRRGSNTSIIDATCGLGRDAFLLADNGCVVTAIERSPIVAALVRDGLDRAARDPELCDWIPSRLRLTVGDARDILKRLSPGASPDVVYLDPMFPPKTKSALVKKEMRILRHLVGDDPDAEHLFEIARTVARGRVVVKRMRHAPPLAPNPTHVYRQKTTRYDVYMTR